MTFDQIRFESYIGETLAIFIDLEDGLYFGGITSTSYKLSDPIWDVFIQTHYTINVEGMLSIISKLAGMGDGSHIGTIRFEMVRNSNHVLIEKSMNANTIAEILDIETAKVKQYFSNTITVY